ncbi:hypothetical protein [Paraburkholderia sp. DGU8]|uniref:hypothetical protein n=1 Tax=Paraburkholderia sp. DGU8 TaxID=3161997 RepID=UPI0034653039
MRYLTYNGNGPFTGAYIQDLLPEHEANHIEVDEATYLNWCNVSYQDGAIVPTPPVAPAPPTVSDYTVAVQSHLDDTAKERNYDGILSACTYATSTNAKFAAEGQACVAWRDACWAYCYQALADVQDGKRAAPTIAGLIADLPTPTWPS